MDLPPAQTPYSVPPAQPEQKSNTTKIILIVVAVLLVLCLISCVVGGLIFARIGTSVSQSIEAEPEDVASNIEKIADIDIPAGFNPGTSMSILGMTFVIYENSAEDSALVVFQMPTAMELTDDNIQTLQDQMEKQSGRQLENYEIIDQYDTTIRGEPGKVIIQEGTSNGVAFRQMLVVFQGKSGLAMMSIFGPSSSWNQAAYDQMVQSIQ